MQQTVKIVKCKTLLYYDIKKQLSIYTKSFDIVHVCLDVEYTQVKKASKIPSLLSSRIRKGEDEEKSAHIELKTIYPDKKE